MKKNCSNQWGWTKKKNHTNFCGGNWEKSRVGRIIFFLPSSYRRVGERRRCSIKISLRSITNHESLVNLARFCRLDFLLKIRRRLGWSRIELPERWLTSPSWVVRSSRLKIDSFLGLGLGLRVKFDFHLPRSGTWASYPFAWSEFSGVPAFLGGFPFRDLNWVWLAHCYVFRKSKQDCKFNLEADETWGGWQPWMILLVPMQQFR